MTSRLVCTRRTRWPQMRACLRTGPAFAVSR
jgi:hypothetical protein